MASQGGGVPLLRQGAGRKQPVQPAIHYQNRLRTADYLALFAKADFSVEDIERRFGQETDVDRVRFASEFSDRSEEDRRTLWATFTLLPSCAS